MIFFKLVNIWQSYKQKCHCPNFLRGCLVYFVCLANTLQKYEYGEKQLLLTVVTKSSSERIVKIS